MFKNVNFESLGIAPRPSEKIELTLSYGFSGFDLDMSEFVQQVKTNGLERARRSIDSARLKLGSYTLAIDWDADEAVFQAELPRISEEAELAAAVGCARCQSVLAPANDVRPYHESFELYRRRLVEVGAVLLPAGVRLGMGFLAYAAARANRTFQSIHSFDALLMLVKSAAADNVGVCLDLWNWHVGGAQPALIDGLTANDVVSVHLADATSESGDDSVLPTGRLLPGRTQDGGRIDAASILVTLAGIGYQGPITPTPNPAVFTDQKSDEIVRQAGSALDEVWSAAGLSRSGKLVSG